MSNEGFKLKLRMVKISVIIISPVVVCSCCMMRSNKVVCSITAEISDLIISGIRGEEFWEPIFGGEESIKKSRTIKLVFFEYVLN